MKPRKQINFEEASATEFKALARNTETELSETMDIVIESAKQITGGATAPGGQAYSAFVLLLESYKMRNVVKAEEYKIFWHYLDRAKGQNLLRKMMNSDCPRECFEDSEEGQRLMLLSKKGKVVSAGKIAFGSKVRKPVALGA